MIKTAEYEKVSRYTYRLTHYDVKDAIIEAVKNDPMFTQGDRQSYTLNLEFDIDDNGHAFCVLTQEFIKPDTIHGGGLGAEQSGATNER